MSYDNWKTHNPDDEQLGPLHEPPPEMCAECEHCMYAGAIPVCCGPGSEFYGGPVVLDGYCPKFERVLGPPEIIEQDY